MSCDSHRTRLLRLPLLLAPLFAAGCILALPGYNEPTDVHLAIVASHPATYTVTVEGAKLAPVPVPATGRVTVHVPFLPRYCSTYLLGLRIRDRSFGVRKFIVIGRNGKIVRKLSMNKLAELRTDELGYTVVKLR